MANKTCSCTSTTDLFALCKECSSKAYHYAEVKRNGPAIGNTYEYHGPLIERGPDDYYREQRLK